MGIDLFDTKGDKVQDKGAKRTVTAVDTSKTINTDIKQEPPKQEPAPGGTASALPPVPVIEPKDADIKAMLAQIQGSGTSPSPGGVGVPSEPEKPIPQIGIGVATSIIKIVYRLPQVMLGFEYEFPPETINERATLLVEVMNQYGLGQMKHLNAIFLFIGVGQDFMVMFQEYKKFKKQKEIDTDVRAKEEEIRMMELEKKKADVYASLNQKLDDVNKMNIGRDNRDNRDNIDKKSISQTQTTTEVT